MLYEEIDKERENIVFVYTICGDIEEARSIGYSAIKEKIAISMDYWVINSIYPWQGIIQEIDQYMLMFSTTKILSDDLVRHIEAIHSYKIPMISRYDSAMSSKSYSLWVENTLKDNKKIISKNELQDTGDINSLRKLK